ncbi:MAG: 23S rRNA (uracil(1939)-C(5))-methyltransferase RlmD [Oscillospiraceae bacterium]|nr:23S rRNA (uracil(1939)-C(5))-methyltransferase RlmD [Oscillospiraceae bacterium]
MVTQGKEYTAVIESVSSDGNGVAHIDNLAVFVPRTLNGDKVKIRIDSVKKRFATARAVEIIEPSPNRRISDCHLYGICGGCQLRHAEYTEQLRIKKSILENAMRRLGGFKDFALSEIVGMENPSRYRNKMIFPVGSKDNKNVCGFYEQKSHKVIPVTDCLLGDEINAKITEAVIRYMNENNVSAYDEKTHTGIIRRVYTRKSFSTGEVMAIICANAKRLPESGKLVDALCQISDRIVSIILNVNTKKNSPEITDKNITLWGKAELEDTLQNIKFNISPQSFFQVNPVQTEKLYSRALEYAGIDDTKHVLDIYCGIGTISLCAAKKAKSVIGVEIVEKAIEDARENAKENGILNAEFYADSAENIVPKLIANGEQPDIVILDPPRKGSDEKTLAAIVKAQPERIVYVSCNPATLARDARYLADNGYAITRASAFDLFPNTVHIETVISMTKNLYTLTFYDDLNGYREEFFIGVFASYDAAESIAKKYLSDIPGFKDYHCEYEIKAKNIIGAINASETVSIIWGWNINNSMNEVDIWESDLYADKNEAQTLLTSVQKEIMRKEWCVDTYRIGECNWKNGFTRG